MTLSYTRLNPDSTHAQLVLNACISFPCQSTLLLNRVTAAVLSDWAGGPHCYNKNISFQCYEYAVLYRPKIVDVNGFEHGEQKQRTKNNSLYDMTSSQEISMVTVKNNWLKLDSFNSHVNKTVHHCTKRKSKIVCSCCPLENESVILVIP